MPLHFGLLLFSFLVSSILIVPFIDFSYRYLKKRDTPTPASGGIFLFLSISLLSLTLLPILQRLGVYITTAYPLLEEANLIFFTFSSFSLVGLIHDYWPHTITPLISLIIRCTLSVLVSCILFFNLDINFFNIPNIRTLHLGPLFIPFASGTILLFSSTLRKSNKLDGLVPGLLFICLLAFWSISVARLDTPLSIFIAVWLGSLLSFLYFTVYPARIHLGQSGSLGFGASLAVVGLLLGKSIALFIIGGLFIIDWLAVIPFKVPLHQKLLNLGWPEPKIVLRAWLAGLILAVFGLWLALL